MIEFCKRMAKRSVFIDGLIKLKSLWASPNSQTDEAQIIKKLARRFNAPKFFVEFGFSGWEFNCSSLINDWRGLLIDGDDYNVKIGKIILRKEIHVEKMWLTLEGMDYIYKFVNKEKLGVLSVDIDGNDYWFLEKLIGLKPSIIIAEYNSSFGLKPVTVPYDPLFDRLKKHESHTYFGASLTALNHLATKNGYSLLEISSNGVSAFFVRDDLLGIDDIVLKPEFAFREKYFEDGSRPSQQWEAIKHLDFIDVTQHA